MSVEKKLEQMTLREKIGQLFTIGFPSQWPTEEFIQMVKEYKVGNVILFSHNVGSREELGKLNAYLIQLIEKETGETPFITIDEEGGVVSRLPKDTAVLPSAMAQARCRGWIEEGSRIVGEELKTLGINFNLAPVLDINVNRKNPVIGIRSFGEDADTVAECARYAVRGYTKAGILCSGKHFPGHGDTDTDSHLALPLLEKSMEELEKEELKPFQALIEEGIPAITISHMLVPAMTKEKVPCTMSYEVVTGYLREKMNYKGLIISDCMEMDAIKKFFGTATGCVEAVKAGVELLFISHTAAIAKEAMDAVEKAALNGSIKMETINQAVQHILEIKEAIGSMVVEPEKAGTEQQKEFMRQFIEEALENQDTGEQKEFSLGEMPLFISSIPTGFSRVSEVVSEGWNFSKEMQETFGGIAELFDSKDGEERIKELCRKAENATSVVFATCNANLDLLQQKLLAEIPRFNNNIAQIALNSPYDLEYGKNIRFQMALYEYSRRTVANVKKYIKLKSK